MNNAEVRARSTTSLDRARVRLAESEQDLAQNGRDQVLFRRALVAIPVVGLCAALVLWMFFNAQLWAAASFGGSIVVALVTSGTGLYMTAVRKREFADAIRDGRAEVARLERISDTQ
jgi:predicted phage tail protein